MKNMSKLKWKWIKFWGYRYIFVYPNKANKEYILYHHRYFDKKQWDNFFEDFINCHFI